MSVIVHKLTRTRNCNVIEILDYFVFEESRSIKIHLYVFNLYQSINLSINIAIYNLFTHCFHSNSKLVQTGNALNKYCTSGVSFQQKNKICETLRM